MRRSTTARILAVAAVASTAALLPPAAWSQQVESDPAAEDGTEGALETGEAEGEPTIAETPPTVAAPRLVPAAQVAATDRWVLLFTADMGGGLVDAPCSAGPEAGPALPRVAAAVAEERRRAGADGLTAPVVLDAGDGLFPSPLVVDLAADPATAAPLVAALRRAGYDALAPRGATLGSTADATLGLLAAARSGDLPVLATNLVCPDEVDDRAACEAAVAGRAARHAIVERGSLRIGLLAVLPTATQDRIRPAARAGAEVSAPADAVRDGVRALRERGVDAVLLVSSLDTAATAPRATLDLLAELEGADRPDLVVSTATASRVARMDVPGGPPVLAAAEGELGRALLERRDGAWHLVEAGAESLPDETDPALVTTLASWSGPFCAAHAAPLARGRLAADLDREAFTGLVLQAMRVQTSSEIAILATATVSPRAGYPMSGQLTEEQVFRAIPDDAELVVATVRGTGLAAFLNRAFDSGNASVGGATRVDGALRVNGREINPDGTYRVVTTAFVAAAGGGIMEESAARWRPAEPGPGDRTVLSERVAHWLASERPDSPYDPESPLDLYRRPLWYGSLTLDGSIADASIWNAAGYNQAQLARPRVFDIRGQAELRAGFNTRDHGWDNHLQLRYGRQRIETEPGTREYSWGESADLVAFRSAYTFDYIRNVLLDGRWYGPSVFAEYRLESEFFHERANEDDDSVHFLEMTGLLGLRLQPRAWLQFQAAGGIRSVLLVPDPYPLPGLSLRAEIIRRRFFGIESVPLFFAAVADYFVGWPVAIPDTGLNLPSEGSAVHKLTLEGRLEFQIYGPLALTASARLFLYDEDTGPAAVAVDTSLGLRVAVSGHTQDF